MAPGPCRGRHGPIVLARGAEENGRWLAVCDVTLSALEKPTINDLGTTTRVPTRKGERIYAMENGFLPWRNLRVPVEKLESTCGANLGWGRAEETWAG